MEFETLRIRMMVGFEASILALVIGRPGWTRTGGGRMSMDLNEVLSEPRDKAGGAYFEC